LEVTALLSNINIEFVTDTNRYIRSSGRHLELINIAEALQEKQISDYCRHDYEGAQGSQVNPDYPGLHFRQDNLFSTVCRLNCVLMA
jgi:hypothetical protein